MAIQITKEQKNALTELIAVARASLIDSPFPEEASKEITEATNIVEEMVILADVDYTDWDEIEKLGDALIEFGGVA